MTFLSFSSLKVTSYYNWPAAVLVAVALGHQVYLLQLQRHIKHLSTRSGTGPASIYVCYTGNVTTEVPDWVSQC